MVTNKSIEQVLGRVREKVKTLKTPIVTMMAASASDPFKILIATVLSLRTRDETTAPAAERLFKRAGSAGKMLDLDENEIIELIYPVGFYRQKARQVLKICQILIQQYAGKVPAGLEELLQLPGVGRKTANLVVAKGFGKAAICVDTHVHRISNRWGYVKTKTPDETEQVLRKKLPKEHWIEINDLLVAYGQGLCMPISPWCSKCVVAEFCARVGVKSKR